MKKKVYSIIGLTILWVICCCVLTGCRPKEQVEGQDDPDLIWIAEEHPLFFQCVQLNGGAYELYGKTMKNGILCDIAFSFGNGAKRGARIHVYQYDKKKLGTAEYLVHSSDNDVLIGTCYEIKKYHCEIQIDQKYNVLVPSSVPVLNIRAYRIDEIEWVDGWPVPNTEVDD